MAHWVLVRAIAGVMILASSLSALADQSDPRLTKLFEQLRIARTENEVDALMQEIRNTWARSGSDSVDVLMTRAGEVADSGDPKTALQILTKIVEIAPRYAEGWYRRAQVYQSLSSPDDAMSDLDQAIELEPRHFGALEGLGNLYEARNETGRALDAYRRILEVVPQLDYIRLRVTGLSRPAAAPSP